MSRLPVAVATGLLWLALANAASAAGTNDLTAELDRHLSLWHETGRFHGVALVAVGDSVVLNRGYGLADRATGRPHGPGTPFDIRSISKQFTCVLILQLAAEGRLQLDDPLALYLPDYRPDTAELVTLDHLLRHTSGIPCFLNDAHRRGPSRPVFDPTAKYAPEEFVAEFLSEDLLFAPGERYSYGNTAYFLLALVAEKVTGRPFAGLVEERLLSVAGMAGSGALYAGGGVDDLAEGYVKSATGFRDCDPWRPEHFMGSGGLYATAGDLLRWNRALHEGRLLPQEWMDFLRSPYSEGPPRHAYAVDHFTLRRPDTAPVPYTGFSGGGQGYSSDVLRFGDGEVIVVLLDNTSQYNHWRLGPEIFDLVAGRHPPAPRPLLADRLLQKVRDNDWQAAFAWYGDADAAAFARGDLERDLNTAGYSVLGADCTLAVAIFRLNAALHPESWNSHDSLGEGLAACGSTAESRASYERAGRLRDRTVRLRNALREQEWNVAKEIVRTALAENPAAVPLPGSMVGPLVEEALAADDLARATALCDVWREAAPEAIGPLFTLARVRRRLGDEEGLAECYRRILELQPDNAAAKEALGLEGER
ncbi:MAG: beta-lactamase family protein [bacterium]|nr:beta-lactamase family protein [bacterium]